MLSGSLAAARCLVCPNCPATPAWSLTYRSSRCRKRKFCQDRTRSFKPHTLCPLRRDAHTRCTRAAGATTAAICRLIVWPSVIVQRIWVSARAVLLQLPPGTPLDPPTTPRRWMLQGGWWMWPECQQAGGLEMVRSTPGPIWWRQSLWTQTPIFKSAGCLGCVTQTVSYHKSAGYFQSSYWSAPQCPEVNTEQNRVLKCVHLIYIVSYISRMEEERNIMYIRKRNNDFCSFCFCHER